LNDQADRYVEWWQTGKYSVNGRCFEIGITTRIALGIRPRNSKTHTSHRLTCHARLIRRLSVVQDATVAHEGATLRGRNEVAERG